MTRATAIQASTEDDIEEEEIEELEALPADEPSIEDRARLLGWHPFAEYKGPPGKWIDAAAFIERGQTILPIALDNVRRLEEKLLKQGAALDNLSRSHEEQRGVIEEMRSLARNADERGYKRALAEAKAERERAVEAGDKLAFQQADEKIEEMEEARHAAAVVIPPKKPDAPPIVAPEVTEFREDNPWFDRDPFLNGQMVAAHLKVMRLHPGMSLKKQLETAADNLKAEFPDMFPDAQPPRQRAAPVATPTHTQPRRKENNGIDSIADPAERAEARGAFNRMKRQLTNYTEEEYMAVYSNPKMDVLESRRTKEKK